MDKRKWVTNASWGVDVREGYNRCACGNDRFALACHTYEDNTRGYIMSCWECGRRIEVDGTEEDLQKAWNEYNSGTAEITYKLTKVPETITIYAKPDDDVNELIKEMLYEKIKVERIPSQRNK